MTGTADRLHNLDVADVRATLAHRTRTGPPHQLVKARGQRLYSIVRLPYTSYPADVSADEIAEHGSETAAMQAFRVDHPRTVLAGPAPIREIEDWVAEHLPY